METSTLTLGTLLPWARVILSNGFSPVSPSLCLLLAELRHRVRSAVLGGVGLSDVPSPLGPRLRGSVWETSLSGSREILNFVRRAVLLSVEASETLTPLSPGLVGLCHPSGLRIGVLLSVEAAEVFSPFSPGYERGKKVIRHTPVQNQWKQVVLWPWAGVWEEEGGEETVLSVAVAVMVITCVLRDVMDNNGEKPRGRGRGKLEELCVGSRAAAEETSSPRNPTAFICLA